MKKYYLLVLLVVFTTILAHSQSKDDYLEILFKAVKSGDMQSLETTLKKWPVVGNLEAYRRSGLLSYAIKSSNKDAVSLLLKSKMPLDEVDSDGNQFSALQTGLTYSNVDFVAQLIRDGYPIEVKTIGGLEFSDPYFAIVSAIYDRVGKADFARAISDYRLYRANGEASGGFGCILGSVHFAVAYEKQYPYSKFLNLLEINGLMNEYVEYSWGNQDVSIRIVSLAEQQPLETTKWDCYALTGTINDSNVRLRSKPSLDGEILERFQKGKLVKIIGIEGKRRDKKSPVFPWLKIVDENDKIGWIYGEFVNSAVFDIINY